MADSTGFIPYCGLPPVPGATNWNLDPVLLSALAVGAALYAWRSAAIPCRERLAFYSGWVVLAAVMISPLCNLGVALFSARIVQHMAVVLIGAPLLIAGGLDRMILVGFSRAPAAHATPPERWELNVAGALFALILWFWHLGGPYDAALRNNVIYWTMDLSLLLVSLFLWRALLRGAQRRPGQSLLVSLFTGIQMSVLGALLTFSAHPWFAVHALTTWPWGLSPLEDQRLGGLIMWVPGGIALTGFIVVLLGRHLRVQPKPIPACASR